MLHLSFRLKWTLQKTYTTFRWAAQIAHQGQLAHHVGKRQVAREWPAGVSPAACPNYPYCDSLTAVVPLGYVNTAGYPAGVNAAVCPGYPYC